MTEKFLHSDTITRLQEWAVDPHTQQPVSPVTFYVNRFFYYFSHSDNFIMFC